MNNPSSYRRRLNALLGDYRHAKRQVQEEQSLLNKIEEEYQCAEEARTLVQGIVEAIQQKAHHKIARVVTRCLKSVFGKEAYDFNIIFQQSRGKTEARLVFVREGRILEDPLDEAGGGCADIAAFALRLLCVILSKPYKRRLLVLDEPLKNISPKYRPLVPELMMTLAKELKVQIIFSTNEEVYACGKIIRIN